jgi:hypothetical protein
MKRFASAATRGPSIMAGASSGPAKPNGLLARIVEALHESRRLEAARVIHQYRHLIAEDFFEQPKIVVVDPRTTQESNANADRDNSRASSDRRALQGA